MLDGFTWFKQSAYQWKGDGLTVYIDPWDLTVDEPADLIVLTHAHYDHYSVDDIARVRTPTTKVVAPYDIANELSGYVTPIAPGETLEVAGVKLQAVPAYNIVEERLQAHPKENRWVGYVLTLGGHDYYHAGDTDDLPELESLRTDVAFVPIGGTYTMDVPAAARLVRSMAPGLAVPMHYGFVVGAPSDAAEFAAQADPVPVETLAPVHPFER